MTPKALWEIPLCHKDDPLSSYQAAETVNLKGWHKRIYDVLKRHDRIEDYTAKELGFLMADEDGKNWFEMYTKVAKRLKGMWDKSLVVYGRPRPSLIHTAYDKDGKEISETTWRAK